MTHPFILAAEAMEAEAANKPKQAHCLRLTAAHMRQEAARLPEADPAWQSPIRIVEPFDD